MGVPVGIGHPGPPWSPSPSGWPLPHWGHRDGVDDLRHNYVAVLLRLLPIIPNTRQHRDQPVPPTDHS
jgi:hypothetical protein